LKRSAAIANMLCLREQDIIDNRDIQLDDMFIASLVFDLVKVSNISLDFTSFVVI